MLQEQLEYLKSMCCAAEQMESTQNHTGHAQSTTCELSELHGEDENRQRATGTCESYFSAVRAVGHCSDGDKGDAVLQLSHSTTEKRGVQRMKEPPRALLPHCAPQKGSRMWAAGVFPPKSRFWRPAWASPPGWCCLLGGHTPQEFEFSGDSSLEGKNRSVSEQRMPGSQGGARTAVGSCEGRP